MEIKDWCDWNNWLDPILHPRNLLMMIHTWCQQCCNSISIWPGSCLSLLWLSPAANWTLQMEMIKIQIALINSDHYWIKIFNQLHSSNWYFDSFTPFRSVWPSFLLIQCLQFAKIKIAAEDFVDNLETAAEALNATNLRKYPLSLPV